MAGKLFVLQKVTDFAPGFLDHTAIEDGCIQLSHEGEQYAPAGTYTSIPFQAEPFFGLIPSWNADSPPGTSVEMFVRVASDGRWSRWFGFGRWSPYLERASRPPEKDEVAGTESEFLSVADGRVAAEMVQLRIQLFSDEAQGHTPRVRLLAVSTNATQQMPGEERITERVLELPAYSCLVRDPAIAGRIAGVTTLTMMMNRWGRDLLPEEVARACYDSAAGRYGSLSFLCAAAGMYGFDSYVCYTGIGALRNEVWHGRAVAARVHYRAPALSGQQQADEALPRPPVLEDAVADSNGHMVAVCGFVRREGREQVLIHDPLAPGDEEVPREVSLSQFVKMYTGLALFLNKGKGAAGQDRPQRTLARLEMADNTLRLFCGDEELAPARLADPALAPVTLCYTLSDGIAYASAAQKDFYYPSPDENGTLYFDGETAAGRKLTCYLIAIRGQAWVAEKTLEARKGEAGKEEKP